MNPTSYLPPADLPWRTATKCSGGQCVRVAATGEAVYLGDSKNPDGPVIHFAPREWAGFIDAIKAS